MPSTKQTLSDKLFQDGSPYHFQRQQTPQVGAPRLAQPNTYQPNRKYTINANSSRDYWQKAYEDYTNRRRTRRGGV